MKDTLVIFPGSFNPFHCGHQNILEKAELIFGKGSVTIAIGINLEKYHFLGDAELKEVINRRIRVIESQFPDNNVEYYYGLLTDYVREKEIETSKSVVVLRGLRSGIDFDYEYGGCRICWDMHPGMKVVMIPCDPMYTHVSSSAYRELESIKSGSGHRYVARGFDSSASSVTLDMVESANSIVIMDKSQKDMSLKYNILAKGRADEFSFEGTYSECLDWVKKQEDEKEN